MGYGKGGRAAEGKNWGHGKEGGFWEEERDAYREVHVHRVIRVLYVFELGAYQVEVVVRELVVFRIRQLRYFVR